MYRQALDNGQPTTEAVADHQNVSLQNAKNLVHAARKAGFLPPTRRGKKWGATADMLTDDG